MLPRGQSPIFRHIRQLSTAAENRRPKTAILMLTMGEPTSTDGVGSFLRNVFTDKDIMQLPLQSITGPLMAKCQTSTLQKRYEDIGGSPLFRYTREQGDLMCRRLDEISPQTGPHKAYVAFRYTTPFSSDALAEIKNDGIKRIVAFPQYPQYSCCTTGSSFNQLYRDASEDPALKEACWSFIDRWPLNEGLVDAFVDSIHEQLQEIPEKNRKDVVLLFTAHSLPLKVVARGDPYPTEVAATVSAVMKKLNFAYPYSLVWQSQMGPMPWLEPRVDAAVESLVAKGHRSLVLIPISFVNEHSETLYELDIEYGQELVEKLKLERLYRAQTPNTNPNFIRGLAEEVKAHLESGSTASPQLKMLCPSCTNPDCLEFRHWIDEC